MFDLRTYRDRAFIEARVRRVVRVPELGECWEWVRAKSSSGYGHFNVTVNGALCTVKAHRAAYELFVGRAPNGLFVLHRCDNPLCCSPAHLFLGDNAANMRDMARKGRSTAWPGALNHNARLTPEQVEEIRRAPGGYGANKALSKRFGVSRNHIWRIRSGESWQPEAA